MKAPFTVRPAGCAAWRENIATYEQAIHERRLAINAGLQGVLVVDADDCVVCGLGAGAVFVGKRAGVVVTRAKQIADALDVLGLCGATGARTVREILHRMRVPCEAPIDRPGDSVFVFPDGSAISTCELAWDVSRPCGCWLGSECRGEKQQREGALAEAFTGGES